MRKSGKRPSDNAQKRDKYLARCGKARELVKKKLAMLQNYWYHISDKYFKTPSP